MDDLTDKISELLSNPSALDQIRSMAEGLLGASADNPPPKKDPLPLEMPPNIDFGKLMNVMGKLKTNKNDERSRLLLALKPHLSDKRQEKVDKAIKILRLLDMLPLLQDSGLLNF